MAFFSVVIPLYNKENFIASTLESVFAQTFPDFEVIVVDDCSTDGSFSIVEKYSDKISVAKHEVNKGLSAARNTGIRNSNSNFIAFLDGDDLWKPFFLQKMSELVSKFPSAGIFASAYEEQIGTSLKLETHKSAGFKAGEMTLVEDYFASSATQPIYCFSSVVIRKKVFENAGYFDESINFGEDTDFNIRAHLQYKLAYYNRASASYVMQSENQITTSNFADKTITDFSKYERFAAQRPSLKKFLDANRYFLAMNYRMAGEPSKAYRLIQEIDPENLTWKQRLLLKSPVVIVGLIRKLKAMLLRKGIRVTTFSD